MNSARCLLRAFLFGFLAALLLSLPARAQLTIGAPQTLSETRIGRTVFEYVMQATVTNGGPVAKGVIAKVTSTSPMTTVVQGIVNFGNVGAGLAASVDTFTIAHDRTVPFDPSVLRWTFFTIPNNPFVTPPISPTNATAATVTGTADPGATVEIVGGSTTVTGTTNGSGAYSISVPLVSNRINKLFVTAIGGDGRRSSPVPADVIHDAQPPSLYIDFPPDGAQLTNDTVIVAGRVGDMLSGFMGLAVKVNNQPANVAVGIGQNGSFERGGVALVMGANTITASATDVNGNAISKTITVTRIALTGTRMAVVSGDAQVAHVHEKLAAPIIVRMTNADGSPFAGKVVTFNVTRSDGLLSAAADGLAGIVEHEAGKGGGFGGIADDAVGGKGGRSAGIAGEVGLDGVRPGIGSERELHLGMAGDGGVHRHRVEAVHLSAALRDGEGDGNAKRTIAGVADPCAQRQRRSTASLGLLVVARADIDLPRGRRHGRGAEEDSAGDVLAGDTHAVIPAPCIATQSPVGGGVAIRVGNHLEREPAWVAKQTGA